MAVDYPGRVDIVPWGDYNNLFDYNVRIAPSTDLDIGAIRCGNTNGAAISWKVLLKAGTYSLTSIYFKDSQNAILVVTIDSMNVGSIDQYAASGTPNAVTTLGGIVIATDGVHTLQYTNTGKNASSSGYYGYLGHITLQRTGPPPPVLMAYRENWAGWATPDATSGMTFTAVQSPALNGGNGGQLSLADADDGDWMQWQFDVGAGTYALSVMYYADSNRGIAAVTIDGVSLGNIDMYTATNVPNTVTTISGIALTEGNHMLRLTVNGKNASSSDYALTPQHFSLERTGA